MDNKQLNNNFDSAVRLWCADNALMLPDDSDPTGVQKYELSDKSDGKGVYISRWDFQFDNPEQVAPTRAQLKVYTLAQVRASSRQRRRRLHKAQGGLQLFYDEAADHVLVSINGALRPISLGAAVV